MDETSPKLKPAHHCHWPNCTQVVPPAMWGCKAHWFSLPKRLRDRIWATYRRGQEITKTPSPEYLVVAREVQDWIAAFQAQQRGQSIAARKRGGSPHATPQGANHDDQS